MDQASSGARALSNSDFPAAIKHYTQALLVNPRAVDYYIKRSTAYSRLKPADGGPDRQGALRDAEFALALAVDRGKRELILAAQMRRGVSLYQLDRLGDAAHVFGFVKERVGGEELEVKNMDLQAAMSTKGPGGTADKQKQQELMMWEMKTNNSLAKVEDGDERRAVNVKDYPDVKIPGEKEMKSILEAQLRGSSTQGEQNAGNKQGTTNVEKTSKYEDPKQDSGAGAAVPTTTPAVNKVRHEWYQSADRVVVTLYVKGVPKADTIVEFEDRSVSISFPTASGTNFDFTLDPLHSSIDTSKSTCSVMSTKIEIVLFKQQPGRKWPALEGYSATEDIKVAPSVAATTTASNAPDQSNPATTTQAAGPAYPTSSKHGTKDWDKVASSLTAKKKTKSSKKKTEGSADDGEKKAAEPADANDGSDSDAASIDSDYGSGDPVDSFFKKLYADADPDTRRAMMKSYYESEGTALSTNWSEVGKGKVDPQPPSS